MQDIVNNEVNEEIAVHRLPMWIWLAVVILAMAVRWPLMGQSLWLDELTTYQEFVSQSTLHRAIGGSVYAPNNHVLYTLTAKASVRAAKLLHLVPASDNPRDIYKGPAEIILRFPAMIAGVLVGLALAWPLRKRPWLALLIALVALLQPWLIAISADARGYSLVLLLCILATNCIAPGEARSFHPWLYALLMAAAIYAVPIAGIVLVAHGLTIAILRRSEMRRWLAPALAAGGLAFLLYAPLLPAMWKYYRDPLFPSVTYRQFLSLLPRVALFGQGIHYPAWLDAIIAAALLLLLMGGSIAAWRQYESLRPAILTYALAVGLSLVAASVIPSAHEVRFVPWLIPLIVISLATLIDALWTRAAGKILLLTYIILAGFCLWGLSLAPVQPMREAARLLNQWAKPGDGVAEIYCGTKEALWAYSSLDPREEVHQWEYNGSFPTLPVWMSMRAAMERQNREFAARAAAFVPKYEKWVFVDFEALSRRDAPLAWSVINRDYELAARLHGRLADVLIYRRK